MRALVRLPTRFGKATAEQHSWSRVPCQPTLPSERANHHGAASLPRARRVGCRRGSESRVDARALELETLNPSASAARSPPPPRARETASSSTTPSAAALAAARDAAFEPVGWREYFDRALDIPVGDVDVFRVYTARDEGANDAAPASSASSASSVPIDTIVLCVHGCPCTAFAGPRRARARAPPRPLARRRRRRPPRGHGETRCANDSALDATRSPPSSAVAAALRRRFEFKKIGDANGHERKRPCVFLVGHSAGGAAAARAASSSFVDDGATFAGVAMVDATEGAGLAAIPRMEANPPPASAPNRSPPNATPSRGRYARVSRETWTPRASPSPRNSRAAPRR